MRIAVGIVFLLILGSVGVGWTKCFRGISLALCSGSSGG
jgi:hypothetical protein